MSVSIRILACVSTICNPDDRPEKREAQLASALKRAYNEQFENYIARNVKKDHERIHSYSCVCLDHLQS